MQHRWQIDEVEYERHELRRGRRFALNTLDPSRTALVVVDMVPFFVDANPYVAGIVSTVQELAAAARSVGGVVAWVVPEPGPHRARDDEFYGVAMAEAYRRSGGEGPLRNRVAAELHIDAADIVVAKSAPSAFFPGRCDLDATLRSASIDTLIVCGTVADVCVSSTVRDAATLGYRTIVAADAVAALDDASLHETLRTLYRSFADVRSTDEIIKLFA